MWFLLLVKHLLSYLKLTKTSSIKVDIRQYSKHKIRKSTGNLTTLPHCFPAETILQTKELTWKKKTFSLEPLVGIFQIWRLLFWFYSVAPSPGADNIWIYILYLIHYYCKQVLRTVRVSSLLSLLNDASVDQFSPEEEFTSPSFFHNTLATDNTAQKMKFSIKDFFSKSGFGHIYWSNP